MRESCAANQVASPPEACERQRHIREEWQQYPHAIRVSDDLQIEYPRRAGSWQARRLLAYNLKRVMNILGAARTMKAMRMAGS